MRRLMLVLFFGLFVLFTAKAIGQADFLETEEVAPAVEPSEDIPTFSFGEYVQGSFFGQGAFWMWIILLVLIWDIIIIIERVQKLVFKYKTDKVSIYRRVISLINEGRIDSARDYLKDLNSPIGNVLLSALVQPYGDSVEELERAIEEATLAEYPKIHKNLSYLAVIANIATLLGLLGTIVGLIMAFYAVSNVPAAQRTQALAVGIQVAMATTAFGLTIAIPTLAVHGFLTAKADRMVSDIDEMAVRLVNFLASRKGGI